MAGSIIRKIISMLILYYAKGTAALPPHIALEEAGIDYEARLVDFSSKEQTGEAYLKINPKARVPSLVTDEGILTEACAILAYIAQNWPQSKLGPESVFQFAKAQEFNCYLASTVHVAHAHRLRGTRWSDDEAAQETMRDKVASNMSECIGLIEKEYFKGPYVLGDQYSICDPYLFLITGWLSGDGVNIDDFPQIAAHRKMMLERPAVRAVMKLHT